VRFVIVAVAVAAVFDFACEAVDGEFSGGILFRLGEEARHPRAEPEVIVVTLSPEK
jgi:hypothetical protein